MQLFFTLLAIFLTWQAILYYRRRTLYKKLAKEELSQEWLKTLEKIPHYNLLSNLLKQKLRLKMLYFASNKEFLCVKCELKDEMKAIVSFYASLMVVGYDELEPFKGLDTILIYPDDVVVNRTYEKDGVYSKQKSVLEGEYTSGTILIAWNEVEREIFHHSCNNVIVHELAHQIDFEEGYVGGALSMGLQDRSRWSKIFSRHYKELLERSVKGAEWGNYHIIGEYASTGEAEFFAVLSERFFQCPVSLKKHFPDLYKELKSFYRIDTAVIFSDLG